MRFRFKIQSHFLPPLAVNPSTHNWALTQPLQLLSYCLLILLSPRWLTLSGAIYLVLAYMLAVKCCIPSVTDLKLQL